MQVPVISPDTVGWLTTDQMIEVDRVMIEDLHIELIQMMENAGRNLARLALHRYAPKSVTVCAGSGGNGGGGLVAARHLHVAGVSVDVVLSSAPERFRPVPAHQLDIVQRIGVPVRAAVAPTTDLILDAMIGYSLNGAPRGRVAELIRDVSTIEAPVLSLDAPSGLDTATGTHFDPHISADATMTLALPKVGLRDSTAVGDLFVADISVPPSVYAAMNAGPAPDFTNSTVVHIAK